MANLRKAFSKIYDENVRRIYRFIFLKVSSEEVAQDLTSQAFLQGWEAFKKAQSAKRKAQKREIRNPSAFLYQIARNLVIDFYRKKGRAEVISTEREGLVIADPEANPSVLEAQIAIDNQMEQVRAALTKLKNDYQDVIIWHYLDDFSVTKIAKILDKKEGTVRVMLHRALKKLRKELEEV